VVSTSHVTQVNILD